jgi:hypothetical protein
VNTKNYDDERRTKTTKKVIAKVCVENTTRLRRSARKKTLSLDTRVHKIQGESEKKKATTDATHT